VSYEQSSQSEIVHGTQSSDSALVQWVQDPMGSVVASSVAVIGSFGLVLSGTWFIHLALN
jgi:hypothetical protein